MIDKSKKIRMRMIAKGITGAEIARTVGVDRTAIYKTIKGKIKSFRLRKAITDALDLQIDKLWTETKRKT